MDWKSKLVEAKSVADKAKLLVSEEARKAIAAAERVALVGNERTRGAIEAYWPTVQRLFNEKLKHQAAAAMYDDQLMNRVLPLVYGAMPFIVRLVVREDEFVQFCFANRTRLLPRLDGTEPPPGVEPH